MMGEQDCEDPEKTKWIEELDILVKHLKAKNKKFKPKRKMTEAEIRAKSRK